MSHLNRIVVDFSEEIPYENAQNILDFKLF